MIIVFGYCVQTILWDKKQSKILISTEIVINRLQNTGYLVENIIYMNNDDFSGGMYDFSNHGARFELSTNDITYDVLIVEADNWELAKAVVQGSNKLNKKMKGEYGLSFYYGSVYIKILPSDKEMANELYDVLNGMDNN